MINAVVEIVSGMVSGGEKKGLRLGVGAVAGLALAVTPAEPGEWARLVVSRADQRPTTEEEVSALMGVLQALDRS